MKYVGIIICLFLFIVIVLIYAAVDILRLYDKPGTVNINKFVENINDLGFGPNKNLIIFEFDVSTIDETDKSFMKMNWSSTTGSGSHTAGIEVKGSASRDKLNYAFEIWAPEDSSIPCTSIETCEDDKAELFDFGEKYEDYVLRGGFREPILFRDAVASQLKGGILEHTLVEVVFFHDNKYFYEGVYLLYPAIQRRFLEKKLDWESKGKKTDCDETPSTSDLEETALIAEYTNPKDGRRKDCDWIENIKMRYPKCDIGTCYHDYITSVVSVITWSNTSFVPLDMTSFVYTFFAEQLLMGADFPTASQYFYKNPDGIVFSGPRWDYDYEEWKLADSKTWNVNIMSFKAAKIWEVLGTDSSFLKLLNMHRKNVTQYNMKVSVDLLNKRYNQYSLGYFDRNTKRWNRFGSHYNRFNLYIESSWEEEIKLMNKTIDDRGNWMIHNPVTNVLFKNYNTRTLFKAIITYPPTIIFIVLLVLIIGVSILESVSVNDYKKVSTI